MPTTFPHASQRLPHLLVRDVQVSLRRFDVGMSEHQLDDPDVNAVREKPARAFMTQVVPVQVDLPQLLALDSSSGPGAFRFVAVRDQQERFP